MRYHLGDVDSPQKLMLTSTSEMVSDSSMRYYRFNRDRSFGAKFSKYTTSFKKKAYMLNTDRTRLLDSCYLESQTWGALHKAWKGYVIAKNRNEVARMDYYANVIQKLQGELGLPISSFPDLGLVPEGYHYEYSEDL